MPEFRRSQTEVSTVDRPVAPPQPFDEATVYAGPIAIIGLVIGVVIALKLDALTFKSFMVILLIVLALWAGALIYFYNRRLKVADGARWERERMERRDIDGAPVIGPPQAHPFNSNVKRATPQQKIANARAAYLAFVRCALDTSTDTRTLMAHGYDGKQIALYRTYLFDAKLAKWKGNGTSHGWEFVRKADEVLKYVEDQQWVETPQGSRPRG